MIMKHTRTLFLVAVALLLTACNHTNQPSQTMNVDWDTPLYMLNHQGDTCSVWTYQELEEGWAVTKNDLPGDFLEGSTTEYYDQNDRLIAESQSYSENGSEQGLDYVYDGKVRMGEGHEIIEGAPSFYYLKRITYYLDDECRYDTLTQEFVKELYWDFIEELDEDEEEYAEPPMTAYTRSRYEATPTGYRLVEKTFYASDFIDPEDIDIQFNYRLVYEYNEEGRMVKETMYDNAGNQHLETLYTYEDNKRIERSEGTVTTTYYKIEQ